VEHTGHWRNADQAVWNGHSGHHRGSLAKRDSGRQLGGVGDRRVMSGRFAEIVGQVELFSEPLGGAVVDLSTLPDTLRSVSSMRMASDSSRVVFVADRDSDHDNELFSVLITCGAETRLSGGTFAAVDVQSGLLIAANAPCLMFRTDRDVDGVFERYGHSLAGSTGVVKRSGTLWVDTSVNHFRLMPSG